MKRKVKKYAGEDGSYVEDDDIGRAIKVGQKPDVEEMKSGIAAGTPTDRQTARDIQSFKAAEVRFPVKKKKPKPEPKASQAFPVRDFEEKTKTTTVKETPSKSSGAGAALGAAAGAVGAGLLAARRSMKEGSRQQRIEPTMGGTRSPVRNISTEEAAWEGEGGRFYKKGGKTKKMASGGNVSSASSRGDGIAQRGKTKGRIC